MSEKDRNQESGGEGKEPEKTPDAENLNLDDAPTPDAAPLPPEEAEAPEEAPAPGAGPLSPGSTLFSKPDPERYRRKKKNRRLRGLIAGAVCICVLVGAMFAVKILLPEKEDADTTSSAADTIKIKTSDVNDLKSVAVKTKSAQFKAVSYYETASAGASSAAGSSEKPTVSWTLEGYDKALLDNYSVSSLASKYAEITAIREMSLEGRALKDFGLDAPEITVDVAVNDGSAYTVLLGNESPTSDGVYLKLADSDKVYLSDLSYKTESDRKVLDFASTSMVTAIQDTTDTTTSSGQADPYFSNGALVRFDRINLSGSCRKEEIRLTFDDSSDQGFSMYKVTAPRKIDADSEKITTLLGPMASGLSAEAVYELNPSSAKLKEYGLDKPLSVIYYEVKSTKVTLKIANAPDSGYYAVAVSGKPVIFKVAKTSLAFAEWQGPDLYATLVFIADIHTVRKITVEKAGQTHTFEIAVQKDESDPDSSSVSVSEVKADGKSVDVDDFKDLYQIIIGLTATEYSDEKKPSGAPEFKMTFQYLDTSKKSSVLTFTRVSERRYWYEIEGAGNILISAEKYNALVTAVMNYFK